MSRANGFIGAVAALGAICIAVASLGIDPAGVDLTTVLLLAAGAAVAQRLPVFLFRSSAISVAFAATIAAYVLYGTGVALLVNLASAAVNAVTPKPKPLAKIVFNTGALTVAAFLAGTTYRLLGGETPPGAILPTIAAVAASGLVYFSTNSVLTAAVIALTTPGRFLPTFRAVWHDNYAWMVLNYLATALNGAGLALAHQALGVTGIGAFLLPLAVAWWTFHQYMANSQLVRAKNEELQRLNARLAETNVDLERSNISIIGAIVSAIASKDEAARDRPVVTAPYAVTLARRLDLPEDQVLEVQRAALSRDFGTLGLVAPTLFAAGRLIPVAAQTVNVVERYKALVADGPGGYGLPPKQALAELRREAGADFGPAVVEAFAALLDEEERSRGRAPGGFAPEAATGM